MSKRATINLKLDGTDHCQNCGVNLNQKELKVLYRYNDKIYCKNCYFQIYDNYIQGQKKRGNDD